MSVDAEEEEEDWSDDSMTIELDDAYLDSLWKEDTSEEEDFGDEGADENGQWRVQVIGEEVDENGEVV
jgi:hypothetical protein